MYERILVPIDGGAASDHGLDEAIALARLTGARIRLLHILDELIFVTGFETGATYMKTVLPALHQHSEGILAAGRERVTAAGIGVETLTVECFARRASDIIVEQASEWPADLIVIGTHGRRGVSRLMLGSDAEQVVRMAPVPVLLVRSGEEADVLPAAAAAATTAIARVGTATV